MMDADQIRKALFPHEETIKRLQAENEELRARVQELESLSSISVTELEAAKVSEFVAEVAKGKGRKRGGDTREES
jgi:predicted RNase H-like nuclease (RuvC/YqgF family)